MAEVTYALEHPPDWADGEGIASEVAVMERLDDASSTVIDSDTSSMSEARFNSPPPPPRLVPFITAKSAAVPLLEMPEGVVPNA
jgi:hypothetical protein